MRSKFQIDISQTKEQVCLPTFPTSCYKLPGSIRVIKIAFLAQVLLVLMHKTFRCKTYIILPYTVNINFTKPNHSIALSGLM